MSRSRKSPPWRGKVYTGAKITKLTPEGAVVEHDAGVTLIPYAQLPKDIQTHYGYDANALAKLLAAGIDGEYSTGYTTGGGVYIELKGGEFTFNTSSDTPPFSVPVHGKFRVERNWLLLQAKDFKYPALVLTVIDGRLAIVFPDDFKEWKDSGHAVSQWGALYRLPPRK